MLVQQDFRYCYILRYAGLFCRLVLKIAGGSAGV